MAVVEGMSGATSWRARNVNPVPAAPWIPGITRGHAENIRGARAQGNPPHPNRLGIDFASEQCRRLFSQQLDGWLKRALCPDLARV